MPLHVNHSSVTVVRAGKRLRVKPTGEPFDFTESEVETIRKAGARIEPYKAPGGARVVAERAAAATVAPEPQPEPPAKPTKGKAKPAPKPSDDDEDEGDL